MNSDVRGGFLLIESESISDIVSMELGQFIGRPLASGPRHGSRHLLDGTSQNGLHGVADGTLREGASRIPKASGPEVMAALRDLVIFVFKRLGRNSAAAAMRHYACSPAKSLEALSRPI
jgi:hypothetical protein